MGLDITLYQVKKYDEENCDTKLYIKDDVLYPEWTKALESEISIDIFDWAKYFKQHNINTNNYKWHSQRYTDKGAFLDIKNIKDESILSIDMKTVPTYVKKVKVLGLKEIGYQRKGLNNKFYDDYRKGLLSYYVWSKAELLRYLNEYCDTETSKTNFELNIINNFIEGEHCVSFDW